MTAVTLLRRDGEWTVDDLRALPDDGLQYELADGVLLVSPSPRPAHQRAVVRLLLELSRTCPPELEVFVAPLDFQPTRRRSLQPDLLVVHKEDVGELAIERPLLLAVEILSPSTRAKDLLVKRALYQDSGVAAMWVVDLDEPSLTGWTLGRPLERRAPRHRSGALPRGPAVPGRGTARRAAVATVSRRRGSAARSRASPPPRGSPPARRGP